MNTEEHSDKAPRLVIVPTYIGSAIGFVAFLIMGAIPGLTYGGYFGLIIAGALTGVPVEPTLWTRILIGGGMLLGLVATTFLFLVVGAITGALSGYGLNWIAGIVRRPVEAPAQEAPTPSEANDK